MNERVLTTMATQRTQEVLVTTTPLSVLVGAGAGKLKGVWVAVGKVGEGGLSIGEPMEW